MAQDPTNTINQNLTAEMLGTGPNTPTARAFAKVATSSKTLKEFEEGLRKLALKNAHYEGGYTKRGGSYTPHQLSAAEERDYVSGKVTLPDDALALYKAYYNTAERNGQLPPVRAEKPISDVMKDLREQALKEAHYSGGLTKRGGSYTERQLDIDQYNDYVSGEKDLPDGAREIFAKLFEPYRNQVSGNAALVAGSASATPAAGYTLASDKAPGVLSETSNNDMGKTITTYTDGRSVVLWHKSNVMVLRGADGDVQRVTRPTEGKPVWTDDSIVTKGPTSGMGRTTYTAPNGMQVIDLFSKEMGWGGSDVYDMTQGGQDGVVIGRDLLDLKTKQPLFARQTTAQPSVTAKTESAAPAATKAVAENKKWHDPREDAYDAAIEKLMQSVKALRRDGAAPEVATALEQQALNGDLKKVSSITEQQTKMLADLQSQLDDRKQQLSDLNTQLKQKPQPVAMPTVSAPQPGLKSPTM